MAQQLIIVKANVQLRCVTGKCLSANFTRWVQSPIELNLIHTKSQNEAKPYFNPHEFPMSDLQLDMFTPSTVLHYELDIVNKDNEDFGLPF